MVPQVCHFAEVLSYIKRQLMSYDPWSFMSTGRANGADALVASHGRRATVRVHAQHAPARHVDLIIHNSRVDPRVPHFEPRAQRFLCEQCVSHVARATHSRYRCV